MSLYYRRTSPGRRENFGAALVAAGVALGVASVSFYLLRTFMARESFPARPPLADPVEDEGAGAASDPEEWG